MKIHEAIAMLEQMDQNKECTVTFGQPKSIFPYPGTPFQNHRYYPPVGPPTFPNFLPGTITCH